MRHTAERVGTDGRTHRAAAAVTCVANGSLELLSGHADGAVVVWWVATGMVMLRVSVCSCSMPLLDQTADPDQSFMVKR
jgi:hypothetical protein